MEATEKQHLATCKKCLARKERFAQYLCILCHSDIAALVVALLPHM